MAVWSTVDVERASVSCSAIGIKWIVKRLLIISVARKVTAGTHPGYKSLRLDTLTARRTISVE